MRDGKRRRRASLPARQTILDASAEPGLIRIGPPLMHCYLRRPTIG